VGNVTGSNSVNVFLGLGTPWLIATIYHTANGTTYEVPAGDLSFGVAIYLVTAVITLSVLMLRRFKVGGELGGPTSLKYGTASLFLMLWFIYVLLSSLKAYGDI